MKNKIYVANIGDSRAILGIIILIFIYIVYLVLNLRIIRYSNISIYILITFN